MSCIWNISTEGGLVLVPPTVTDCTWTQSSFSDPSCAPLGVPRTLANPAIAQSLGNEEQVIREYLCGSAAFLSTAWDSRKNKRRIRISESSIQLWLNHKTLLSSTASSSVCVECRGGGRGCTYQFLSLSIPACILTGFRLDSAVRMKLKGEE